MIVYTEFHDATVHVIAMPNMEASCATTITCNMDYDHSQQTWILSRKHIALIDAILDPKTIMIWTSPKDMDRFISLVRRHSDYRVARNSYILPTTVVSGIQSSNPVTPAILIAALAADGIKTAADLRHRKAAL